jgi:uncharacterized protein
MERTLAFVRRSPVVSFYIVAFAISWGLMLVPIGLAGIPATTTEQLDALLPVAIVAMLGGPSIAGLLVTGLVSGRAGFRDLLARLGRWQVAARWYAVALLTAPLSMAAALLVLAQTSPEFLPGIVVADDKGALLLMGILVGLIVGVFEELGWTGFVVPRLRRRHGVHATGIVVGVLWGAWHILSNGVWPVRTTAGALPIAVFLPLSILTFLVGQLVAYRVLMVWVYEHTESLLVAMLMHASLTASTLILVPSGIAGAALVTLSLAYAATAWAVVAVVAIADRRPLSRPPMRRRVA